MDQKRFLEAIEICRNENAESGGIGTLKERTLHRVIKTYLEPDRSFHEVKIGRYCADIAYEDRIIEIQTRNFRAMKKKLETMLNSHKVTLVYPISHIKHLVWSDPETGEMSKPRKSPKTGRIYDIFAELDGIAPLHLHENFSLKILLINTTEYKLLNGWGRDKKRGAHRQERIPSQLIDEIDICCTDDFTVFLPENLPKQFTSKDYKSYSKLYLGYARTAVRILSRMGIIKETGKLERMKLYEIADESP